MQRFIIILICGVCAGCMQRISESRGTTMQHTDHSSLDEQKVIEIGRTTLSTNSGFEADRVSYQVSRQSSNWCVTVWREPKMPGGFCTLEITHEGKVIRLFPGY